MTVDQATAGLQEVLEVFRKHRILVEPGADSIQWKHLCKVLQVLDPTVFGKEALELLFAKCKPEAAGADAEPGAAVQLDTFFGYIFAPEGNASKVAGVPNSGRSSITSLTSREPQVRVRRVAGDLVFAVGGERLDGLTVAMLKKMAKEHIDKQRAEIRLLADGRPLENQELVKDVLDGRVLEVLMLLSEVPQLDPDKRPIEQLDILRDMVASEVEEVKLEGTVHIRKLLSIEHNPPIQDVIDSGVLPLFVGMCNNPEGIPQHQFEAAWALTNVASGSNEHTRAAVDLGAATAFVNLLRSPDADVREQAVWGLGNIAGDSPAFRDMVHEHGALQPILDILAEDPIKISCLRNTTWAMSNLMRGKPSPPMERVQPALPTIERLLQNEDTEVLTDACWSVSYISDGSSDRIQAVLDANLCGRLVALMHHENPLVVVPALRATGNIVTGDDLQTQAALDCGVLAVFQGLLAHQRKSVRKETCWSISNVLAGTAHQIQQVVDQGLVPVLTAMAFHEEHDVKKEIAWAVANLCEGGSEEHIAYAVGERALEALLDFLSPAPPAATVRVVLTAIERIIQCGARRRKARGLEGVCNEFLEIARKSDRFQGLEEAIDQAIGEDDLDAGDLAQRLTELLDTEGEFTPEQESATQEQEPAAHEPSAAAAEEPAAHEPSAAAAEAAEAQAGQPEANATATQQEAQPGQPQANATATEQEEPPLLVEVLLADGRSLGLASSAAQLTAIPSTGSLLLDWNSSHPSPRPVKDGDVLISVNGVRGTTAELRAEIKKAMGSLAVLAFETPAMI